MGKTGLAAARNSICRATLLAALLLLGGCAVNPVTGDQDFVLMSEEQEMALGRQYNAEILKHYGTLEDPELQTYVEGLVEELGEASHRDDLVWHVTVLDSPEVNAFALPGGYVYITRGIMAYLNSEAQLAGVLGHELGHVTARHGVQQHSAATLTGLLGVIVAAGTGSRAATDLSQVLGTAVVRGYGREHELEADRLGAEYLARLGYDPQQMIEVVGVLKDQEAFEIQRAKEEGREPRVYHGVFSTHPDNDQRLQEVVQAANRFESAATRPNAREAYLGRIDGMVFGPGEDQGVLRGRRFYHKNLDFTVEFPQDWRVENRPDRLLAVSRDNDAIIQVTVMDLNKRQSPEMFLREAFDGLDRGEVLAMQGLQAYTGVTQPIDTPFGSMPARVAVVFHDKRAFVFAAVAKASSLAALDPKVLPAVRSFRELRDEEIALAEPQRIHIVIAGSGDSFAGLARELKLGPRGEAQLRLLNGLWPDGEPEPGQLIKVIR